MTQKDALDILKLGHNVYLTGSAGTGKTYVLNAYIKHVVAKRVTIGITASTGIAATHLGGITIDSWSGLGNRDDITDDEIAELEQKLYLKIRYLSTKILLIDEVSMLAGKRLDAIDRIARKIRNSDLPFGGMQVIVSGDFFQLPPYSHQRNETDFVFKSTVWQQMNIHICYLTYPYRQVDPQFLHILHAIRRNQVDDATLQILIKTLGQPLPNWIAPTKLYTHNIDVDAINNEELDKIQSPIKTYHMQGRGKPGLVEILKKSCLAPERLELKKGSQVMFVKNNYQKGYVNGTMGKVVGFTRTDAPVVHTLSGHRITVLPTSWTVVENNMTTAEINQLPLRLAWAITVHKSQGMSLDMAEIDLSKSFIAGMGYVALSRVKTLKGLRLLGVNEIALRVNPEVIAMDKKLMEMSQSVQDYLHKLGWLNKIMRQRNFMTKITS